jgi:hypothetical protein
MTEAQIHVEESGSLENPWRSFASGSRETGNGQPLNGDAQAPGQGLQGSPPQPGRGILSFRKVENAPLYPGRQGIPPGNGQTVDMMEC